MKLSLSPWSKNTVARIRATVGSWPPRIVKIYGFLICGLVWVIWLTLMVVLYMKWRNTGIYDYSQVSTRTYCDEKSIHNNRFLSFPMLTIIGKAGIGNQLFEVFSLLGMARTLNRTAIFNSNDWALHTNLELLNSKLPQVAEQVISIPIEISEATRYVNSPACCHFQMTPLLHCEQSKFVVVDGFYFQSFKYFSPIESSIRKWLKPPEKLIQKLEKEVEQKNKLRFKTCVHIRRGDFATDGQHAATDRMFAINAIDYLYSLHPGMIYLFSNDPHWTQTRIAYFLDYQRDIRVMETPAKEALYDLYFSQVHCDSVLITAPSSTFGWWMGYLSKNTSNVYYRDIREVDDKVKHEMIEQDFYPATWKKLKIAGDERISVVE